MDIVKKLISFGYLPKEIPSEFQSESLANSLDNIKFDSLGKEVKSQWSKSVVFSIPKSEDFRRVISIPAPIHQILLCKLIGENWEELQDHFNLSTVSMTSPVFSEKNNIALESKSHISEKKHIRIKHLHNKKYILQSDISRYYPTIYTHVIPWALHTKEYAKKNIRKNKLLGNKIDMRIQYMQDGQTFGIPIGPITSQIISEIIGSAIDNDFKTLMGCEVQGYRYTDDIEYYFDSEERAKDARSKLNRVVSEYQLELNQEKTKIVKAPIAFEPEWKQYFTRFYFRKTVIGQKNDINLFFSQAFNYKHIYEDKGILTYAIKKIRREVIHKDNWSVFEALLLHTSFSDSNTLPLVLEIIEGYKIKGYDIDISKVKEFVEELIRINFNENNHYEISWALVFAKRLNIRINSDITALILKSDNSIICILTMMLNDKGLLNGNLDFNHYKRYLNTEELWGSNWLFAYESFKQGWLKPYPNPRYVLEDPFFKILFENDVTFLSSDIDIQDLYKISRKAAEGVVATKETMIKETDEHAVETSNPESEGETEDIEEISDPRSEEETEEEDKEEMSDSEFEEETEEEDKEEMSDSEFEEETEEDKEEMSDPESEEETEEMPESESEGELILDMLLDDIGSSLYKDSEWMFQLLGTDLEKDDKIKSTLVESDY